MNYYKDMKTDRKCHVLNVALPTAQPASGILFQHKKEDIIMNRILALVLCFTLLCTTAFSAGKEEKKTTDDMVNVAKLLAAMIAYEADEPVTGKVETVEIGGRKVKVHSDFKYAMDVFYAFYKDYFGCLHSMDLNSILRLNELAGQVETIDKLMDEVNEMELSKGDRAYYLEVYSEIIEMMDGDYSDSSSDSGDDGFGLDDLSDMFNGFGF